MFSRRIFNKTLRSTTWSHNLLGIRESCILAPSFHTLSSPIAPFKSSSLSIVQTSPRTTLPSICRTFSSVAAVASTPSAATPSPFSTSNEAAELIFNDAWSNLESRHGVENLKFPKEIMWLGGAPGSGKGTNTNFIMRERGYTAQPIVMSSLLNSPMAQAIKAQGGMVGDREVVECLLDALLNPVNQTGVVVDGFPRTKIQADVIQKVFDKMLSLHRQFGVDAGFQRPIFRICVLHVGMNCSVERQLSRGQRALVHNAEVRESGEGELQDERPTDFDPELAKKRYRGFVEQTFNALEELGKHFIYNFINAQGTLEQVEKNIAKEMMYQSKLELNAETHEQIRDLPRAYEMVAHCRQVLVRNLDNYQANTPDLFKSTIDMLKDSFYPVIEDHAIAGRCVVLLPAGSFQDKQQIRMAMDVLADRGFLVSYRKKSSGVWRFDLTWETTTIRKVL